MNIRAGEEAGDFENDNGGIRIVQMLIVAHRGASARAPGNTIAAFRAALDDGAPAVEFDVRMTGDDRLVISHDDEIATTTEGIVRISSLTLAEIQDRDSTIPSFEQVVALLSGRATMFVEAKGAWTGERYISAVPVVEAVAPALEASPAVLSSFEPDAVSRAVQLGIGCPTGLASLDLVEAGWTLSMAVERGFDEVHVPDSQIHRDLLDRAHGQGKRVLGWTVNDPVRALELAAMGCDGVFTDDPAMLLRVISDA